MTFTELTGAAWHEIKGGYLRPPIEIVGKFQILVKLNSMHINTSVSIARILWLNEHKQHEEW
jgi:hypothetical protein